MLEPIAGGVRLRLRPFQIVTLRLPPARPKAQD